MEVSQSNLILMRVLDLTAARQRVLSNNLANLNTPGFQRSDLNFEEELAEATRGGPNALMQLSIAPKVDESTPTRFDGNNVQLETELAEMARNALLYQFAAQTLSGRMATMKMAVTGKTS